MEILKPYRRKIDDIDAQIIALLRARYDVIAEVGHLKAREGIAAVLPERVEEVRENAIRIARQSNLDADFIGRLYAQLIDHSCALEDSIITGSRKKSAAK